MTTDPEPTAMTGTPDGAGPETGRICTVCEKPIDATVDYHELSDPQARRLDVDAGPLHPECCPACNAGCT